MPFETQWSRLSLRVRWLVCGLIAAACVVALVVFVEHNDSNGEVQPSKQKLRVEAEQAAAVIGSEQAPKSVRIAVGESTIDALARSVRRDLQYQIREATIDGPLQSVHCVIHGGTLQRTGYHCLGRVAGVDYPFLAVVTPRTRHGWYCEKVYPPQPSENIPVSARCRA